MPTKKKAVREAAVDWCLKNDLHDDSVDAFWRFFFIIVYHFLHCGSIKYLEEWSHLGSTTILGVHIMQMLQM